MRISLVILQRVDAEFVRNPDSSSRQFAASANPLRVREKPSIFHPRVQRNAFCRRDVRSAIEIVHPLESIAGTQPQAPTFPQTVANDRFCPSIVRFRRRIEMKCFCTWDIGRLLLMERAE